MFGNGSFSIVLMEKKRAFGLQERVRRRIFRHSQNREVSQLLQEKGYRGVKGLLYAETLHVCYPGKEMFMGMKTISQKKIFTEAEVIKILKEKGCYYEYSRMSEEWRKRFMDFCAGIKTLPLTYDVTFKRIFHPNYHAGRLSNLISSVLGQKVKVKEVLLTEDWVMDNGSLVIMDIIVQLEDGSIANVEIQKSPHNFAGERLSCYSSDLVLRQYSKLKALRRQKFSYKDMSKVYTIVLFEKTGKAFHATEDFYSHCGKTTFDSGLQLNMLQEYYLIALDRFMEIAYHKSSSKLAGWLSLLVTEGVEDAEENMKIYPWLREIYEEIATFRQKPEEVFGMYSEMIRELDRNSMQCILDEQKEEIEKNKIVIEEGRAEIEKSKAEIEKSKAEIEKSKAEIERNKAEIEALRKQLANKDVENANALEEIENLKRKLAKN